MSSRVHTYGDALLDEGRLRACDALLRISSCKGRMFEMGQLLTSRRFIELVRFVPQAEIQSRSQRADSLALTACDGDYTRSIAAHPPLRVVPPTPIC